MNLSFRLESLGKISEERRKKKVCNIGITIKSIICQDICCKDTQELPRLTTKLILIFVYVCVCVKNIVKSFK